MDVGELVRDQLIAHAPGLLCAYLFGSAARGELRTSSDLDVAVLGTVRLDDETRWQLQERLAANLGRNVDLVDLRSASTVMQMQVVSGGRVILDHDAGARRHFEGLVYAAYARLNEERRPVLEAIEKSGSVYGR